MSVLVVDDLGSMRMQIRDLLWQMGFQNILEARDGNQAIGLLERSRVDFIISDWSMPECDGMELLRHVRSSENYAKLPFLMLTALSERENVIEAVQAKVSNYLVKPFTPESLEMKMRAILGCKEPLWEK